jgi:hypothetical protein
MSDQSPQQQQHKTGLQQQQQPGFVFVVGMVESLEDLPAELAQCFSHHIEAQALLRDHYSPLLAAMLQPLQQQQQQQQQGASIPGSSSSNNGSTHGLSAADITAAATQMVGLLPSDVAGVVADAAAAAAASSELVANGPTAEQQQQQQQQQLPHVERVHLEQALKRVKARTATEIGAPQVNTATGCLDSLLGAGGGVDCYCCCAATVVNYH